MIEVDEELFSELLNIIGSSHPWPWRIDTDWGHEVIDANNNRIALFRTRELADKLLELGEKKHAEVKELIKDLKEDFNAEKEKAEPVILTIDPNMTDEEIERSMNAFRSAVLKVTGKEPTISEISDPKET